MDADSILLQVQSGGFRARAQAQAQDGGAIWRRVWFDDQQKVAWGEGLDLAHCAALEKGLQLRHQLGHVAGLEGRDALGLLPQASSSATL
jgi:hypothetical protein